MKGEIVDLKTAKQPGSLFLTQAEIDQFIEENADLYRETVAELGRKYCGNAASMVTDKDLHWRIYMTHARGRVVDDRVMETIEFADMPGWKFHCIQLGFKIDALSKAMGQEFVAWKWFFFKVPKQFKGVTL